MLLDSIFKYSHITPLNNSNYFYTGNQNEVLNQRNNFKIFFFIENLFTQFLFLLQCLVLRWIFRTTYTGVLNPAHRSLYSLYSGPIHFR